ncbi:MAG: germination protein YpeB [Oscillospiraceae bacterium]|nr:germination protein YpeB [Oscillospiraceae bacterium]
MPSLSRRALIRAASFAVFGVMALAGCCVMGWRQASLYRGRIENEYQRALAGLTEAAVSIDTALQKGLYANSPVMISALACDISRKAAGAQKELYSLPFSSYEMENTAKFLSQLGDWAYAANREAASGQPMPDGRREQLRNLSGAARGLSARLSALTAILAEERVNIGRLLVGARGTDIYRAAGIGDSVTGIESTFSELPPLVYDGALSDHIEGREALFLKDQPEIDAEAAILKAAGYLDIKPALLQPAGESEGPIPAYGFLARIDGGEVTINISKRGGHAVSILNSREPGEPRLTFEQAIQKAKGSLETLGFEGMRESRYTRSGNTLLIMFHHRQNDTVYYTDMIRVGVALDNGRLQILESTGYLMNHAARGGHEGAYIPVGEAKERLSPELFVADAELCVVSTDGLNELLCYGFTCIDPEGRTFLIYVNALTGVEERILILIEDENGSAAV